MERPLPTVNELREEARRFVTGLLRGSRATLVTLSGELGAGKTTFVQAAAEALGVDVPVQSPTFVLEKIYLLTDAPFERLVHIDAYRLSHGGELQALGFDDVLQDPGNLIMLEWPERVRDALPEADVAISLSVRDAGRAVSYDTE